MATSAQETYIELNTKPLLRAYRQEIYKLAQTQLKEPEKNVEKQLTALKRCYDILKDIDKDEAASLQTAMSLN